MFSKDLIKMAIPILTILMAIFCTSMLSCGGVVMAPAEADTVKVQQQPVDGRVERNAVSTTHNNKANQDVKSRRGNGKQPSVLLGQLKHQGEAAVGPRSLVHGASPSPGDAAGRKRSKRNCSGGCGCCGGRRGSGSGERRRRRNRKRARARAHFYQLHRFLTAFNRTSEPNDNFSSTPDRLFLNDAPMDPGFGKGNVEVESSEIIIFAPVNSNSNETITNNSDTLVMPFVGTYGSKLPPGAVCKSNEECAVGAKCVLAAGVGHCVCQAPLINLGNACVPRSGAGF